MMTLVLRTVCTAVFFFSGFSWLAFGDAPAAPQRLWKPVADEVFLQEAVRKIAADQPIEALAILNDTLYAVQGGDIRVLRGDALQETKGAPAGVYRLRALEGALWAASKDGAYRLEDGAWTCVDKRAFTDFCAHLGNVYGATPEAIFRYENGAFVDAKPGGGYLSSDSTMVMEDFSQVLADPVEIGPIQRIVSYSGTLYLLNPGRLALIEGATFVEDPVDWGAMPSRNTRDMLSLGGCLYVATDRGVAVLRGMALTALQGKDGLPYEDTTCLAQGFDGDLWIGTTRGAIRWTADGFHYFGADHWLPDDHVHDIAAASHVVYIATGKGLSILSYEPYTLLKKAAYYERELEEWGHKRLGFVHKLYWSDAENGWIREVSDNDGGHTAHYLAAMSYKFAATGDERARAEAVDAFLAMVWLEEITPKEGFIARSIWSVQGDKGERGRHGSGGLPAKWYPTDDGLWYWKGDTSSDEVNGHMYSVSIFHDLVAQGPEKERAARHIARIAAHIMDNGWVLRDMDGKPTRWGRWDPDYLLRPYGFEARGLNGLEAQTYMRTAYALTSDPKFEEGYQQLLQWRYHTYTVRQKLTFPPESVVPWDDELAFRCYHPLLQYTTDPDMRSIYLRSLERSWEVMRMQHLPFFNFTYGALTGNDCEVGQAVKHLREWPLDVVSHSFRNSHRHDLFAEPGYVPYCGGTRAMSPRDTACDWGGRTMLEYDGGGGGRAIVPPVCWLEDYWMGRYYGMIEAPTVTDNALTEVPPATGQHMGAAPYDGSPRPGGLIPEGS
ncbi:MAG: hypothetical protein KA184_14120 [Candidatus Hydrogenedentes bacterium]|nr:hypothetical protein [Candidatus Hydrogenedentota bacterium]